jgi:hypothetical protein
MSSAGWRRMMRRPIGAALVLALGGILTTAGTTMAAFQIVHMSMTSGEPCEEVALRVEASHLIGGSEKSQVFLIPQDAWETRSEPARCDAIRGATVAGELLWVPAPVEFQGNTYPGFVGAGSFTVPEVATGVYVVSGILDDPYTGCHAFTAFGVGMELPDTASATAANSGLVTFVGIALFLAGVLRLPYIRRTWSMPSAR